MAVVLVFWSAMAAGEPERLILSEGGPLPRGMAWQVAERVTRVEMVLQTAEPPHLLVRAVGVLPAGEYDRIELVQVFHTLEPRDGMQVFRIVAVPAAGAKAAEPGAAAREVNVVHQWKNFQREAPWLRGVRVYAKAGSVEKRWTEPGKGEGPLKVPSKEPVSHRGSSGDPENRRPGAPNSRMERVKRWRINLAYEDPKEFVRKLGELKVEVGARLLDGSFRIYTELATSSKPKQMTIVEFQKYAHELQCVWLVTHDRNTCENFKIGVGLDERPTTIFLFVPQEMEKAIVDAETKHHDLTEKEIKEKKIVTKFDVTRKEKGWEVKVTGSYVDAKLKYDK